MPDDHTPEGSSTRIVGLGASAGGLEALEQFLANVPSGSGLAYVVVQHLDPTHKAMLSELLQRATMMPVREAVASMQVQPDVVYVIPPNSELTVIRGALHLAQPVQPRGMRLPIDVLFSSLARDQGERAIGVVLSGMGSDGTLGLQAIKSQGGLTLAQEPESAQFDSMPRNAIAGAAPDIVARAADLPRHILRVVTTRGAPVPAEVISLDGGADPLRSILDLVRGRSKHDLASYKPSTLRRRIERRMGVHNLSSLASYEQFLRANPDELDLLFKEMLIGVTGFFRDPAVWQSLKDRVLPALLARRSQPARLRAWVAGCSTGEEAYSLAIIFREVVAALPEQSDWALQIFATDLSADAIQRARNGHYAATIADSVGAERLGRFFRPDGDGFQVSNDIRETVLFAQHDMILDAPFTRLDILCCRNVMIYFNAPLQERLVKLFHYVLRPGGLLILGESESIGRSHALFLAAEPKLRLYQRSDNAPVPGSVDFPSDRGPSLRAPAQESNVTNPYTGRPSLQTLADQVVLNDFALPAVLVNEQGDVLYISGRTGRYLEPAAGKANWNIHVMARPALRAQLAAALRRVTLEKTTVELRGLALEEPEQSMVDITVKPIREPKALAGTVMIVFREAPKPPAGKARRRRATGSVDPELAEELARSHEEIRTLRQEMRTGEEERQATNEELQSTNEELQSANEELTTSKEESQSMNEELQTINTELQSKLDDLALAQSDMQNLLNSIDIATLFLDNHLNVRRFTERITRIIHLREGDVGRPLTDLASTLIYPELHTDAMETLRTLAFCEKQIPTTDGHWYSVRIMPYRTISNVIQGAVITFVDITTAKELEARLRRP